MVQWGSFWNNSSNIYFLLKPDENISWIFCVYTSFKSRYKEDSPWYSFINYYSCSFGIFLVDSKNEDDCFLGMFLGHKFSKQVVWVILLKLCVIFFRLFLSKVNPTSLRDYLRDNWAQFEDAIGCPVGFQSVLRCVVSIGGLSYDMCSGVANKWHRVNRQAPLVASEKKSVVWTGGRL